ncbi:MAG: J domain-containing protein, partial [Isosphaeraceae bacterium]
MSSFSFDIDPQAVLGVPADATLEQIRDAYHQKCKTFHPDAGGEEWAFRVLVQSYELLSTARVLRATRAEPVRGQAEPAPATARPHEPSAETV